MRIPSVLFFLLIAAALHAQPDPPNITFTVAMDTERAIPFEPALRVEQHFRYQRDYDLEPQKADQWDWLHLQSAALLEDTTTGWRTYRISDCWCSEQYLLLIAGPDTMRLDLPHLSGMVALVDRARSRWDRNTPETIRFRQGRFAFADVITERAAIPCTHYFAEQLIREQGLRDGTFHPIIGDPRPHPPKPLPGPKIQPPTKQELWQTEMVKQPPLKELRVDRVSADTVWVRVTGRVMLDGGCGSHTPLFGLEMLTDTGWVERIPLDQVQMDCGMPWADWEDQLVMMPSLRSWVARRSYDGHKTLAPGAYRFCFLDGDGTSKPTATFSVVD
jgi:hypothetical protein